MDEFASFQGGEEEIVGDKSGFCNRCLPSNPWLSDFCISDVSYSDFGDIFTDNLENQVENLDEYLNNYNNNFINSAREINNYIDANSGGNILSEDEKLEIMGQLYTRNNSHIDILKTFLLDNEYILENNYNLEDEAWNKRVEKCEKYTCNEDCNL